VVSKIIFKTLANFCQLRIKNKIKSNENKKPLLLLTKIREKVKAKASQRKKRKEKIERRLSGGIKKRINKQQSHKKMLKINVGKKFLRRRTIISL